MAKKNKKSPLDRPDERLAQRRAGARERDMGAAQEQPRAGYRELSPAKSAGRKRSRREEARIERLCTTGPERRACRSRADLQPAVVASA